MRIIHSNPSTGIAAITSPSPKWLAAELAGGLSETNALIKLANQVLPNGTKYAIVADSAVPTDRTFRNAWEYTVDSDSKTATSS